MLSNRSPPDFRDRPAFGLQNQAPRDSSPPVFHLYLQAALHPPLPAPHGMDTPRCFA
jgi:hypothetical protein